MKLSWPAPERNKLPILEVLRRVLPSAGRVLEISSGTGQHAAFFAAQLPGITWQSSDMDDQNLASIHAWVEDSALTNLPAPVTLDVCSNAWPVETRDAFDAIFNANMVHIAPWECCVGLIAGAARHLKPHGLLIVYGPFRIGGAHTSESNETFDAGLKARDPRWGVRDLEAVVELAEGAGFSLRERVQMPANNQMLVFERNA